MSAAFEAAKATRARLDEEVERTSARLELFPKNGPMGLTPDHVKFSPEFRAAKRAFDQAFANLRNFNAVYTVQFAAELRAERLAGAAKLVDGNCPRAPRHEPFTSCGETVCFHCGRIFWR